MIDALERNRKPDYALYPGLTPQEIDEKTQDIPFSFPEELYELYQWCNGRKRREWKQVFVDGQEFLPLDEAISLSRNLSASYPWNPRWLIVFIGRENCGAYVVELGAEVATVRNFDPEDDNYSIKYPSLTHMMLEGDFEASN